MTNLHIALVQMTCEKGAIRENIRATRSWVDEAMRRGADIVCFPEMSITGYAAPNRPDEELLDLDSAPVAEVVAMTEGRNLTVLAGLAERNPNGKPYIAQIVAADGQLDGFYRKVTIPEDESPWFSAGSEVRTFERDGVPFGVAICADHGNPRVFHEAAAAGARIVFLAAAPGLYGERATRDWKAGFAWWRDMCLKDGGANSREQGIVIAVSTQTGRTVDEDFPGGCYVFDASGNRIGGTEDWAQQMLDIVLEV